MAANSHHISHEEPGLSVAVLERMDNWAHIVVAAFFILMATTVIIHMSFIFVHQIPLIIPAATPAAAKVETPATVGASASEPGHGGSGKAGEGLKLPGDAAVAAEHAKAPEDPFVRNSLELLSNILFVVILLELLRTIITYLQTHDIQAIMQEFLVVGIISSVRKILLVGAEASLVGSKGIEFIQEATGVVIDIIGIMLLIMGLVLLKRAFGEKSQPGGAHG